MTELTDAQKRLIELGGLVDAGFAAIKSGQKMMEDLDLTPEDVSLETIHTFHNTETGEMFKLSLELITEDNGEDPDQSQARSH